MAKPSPRVKAEFQRAVMSAKQAKRVEAGDPLENSEDDIAHLNRKFDDEARRMRDARHACEDRRMMRELGLI